MTACSMTPPTPMPTPRRLLERTVPFFGKMYTSLGRQDRSLSPVISPSGLVDRDVPTGSPPRGGDVAVYEPTELACSFRSVLVSVSICMALSTVFHSISSPENSLPSHSVL